jgi:hypothetical protein
MLFNYHARIDSRTESPECLNALLIANRPADNAAQKTGIYGDM